MLLYITTSQLLLTSLTISLKLGLIDEVGDLQPLCEAALNEAKQNAACVSDPIEIVSRKGCESNRPARGTSMAAELFFQENVDGYIAPPCSDEQEQIGRLGYFWKRPVFARTMSTPFAMNPTYFPNTVNVATASSAGLSHALIEIARLVGEVQMTLVGPTPLSSDHYTITNAIHDYLNFTGSQLISTQIQVDADFKDLSAKIRSIEMSTKVVAFGTDFEDLAKAMRWLEIRRLSDHYYITIMVCSSPVQNCFADDSARSLLDNSGIIVLAPRIDNYTMASSRITPLVSKPVQGQLGRYIALYNSCYGYCFGTKISGVGNTQTFASTMKMKSFSNSLGTFRIDGGGTMLYDYCFYTMKGPGGKNNSDITLAEGHVSITDFVLVLWLGT